MRTRSVLVALSAGLAAAAAVRRFVGRRQAAPAPAVIPAAPVAVPVAAAPVATLPQAVGVQAARAAVREAVVLPFTRPAAPVAAAPAPPARCGENGGRTKAGAPCGARGLVAGRCHHHRVAA